MCLEMFLLCCQFDYFETKNLFVSDVGAGMMS